MPQSGLLMLTCDGCGASADVRYGMWPVTVSDALVGNCCGLSLWLQVPCAGQVFWAFDARHLAHLKEFIQADLRERCGATNASVMSRLPGWLEEARLRAVALRAVDLRLERVQLRGLERLLVEAS